MGKAYPKIEIVSTAYRAGFQVIGGIVLAGLVV